MMMNNNETENLLDFMKATDNLMSRDYVNMTGYLNKISPIAARIYFQESILNLLNSNIIQLKDKDVDQIIGIGNPNITKLLANLPIKTTIPGQTPSLPKYIFPETAINAMIKNISSGLKKNIIDLLKSFQYKYVIDGGNILHNIQGKLNQQSFINMNHILAILTILKQMMR